MPQDKRFCIGKLFVARKSPSPPIFVKAKIKIAHSISKAVNERNIQNVDEPKSAEIIPGADDNLKAKPTATMIAAACELYIVPKGRFLRNPCFIVPLFIYKPFIVSLFVVRRRFAWGGIGTQLH